MEILLNRWRGAGVIFASIPLLTGVLMYALYLGLLIGFSAYSINYTLPLFITDFLSTYSIYLEEYQHSILIGWFAMFLFMYGESFAWGKWVGYLVSEDGEKEYSNTNGKKFPYIHQIANYFFKEKENYRIYCRFALTLRGFVWWTPILTLIYHIDLIGWHMLIINSIVLSFGFPFACELSKYWKFEYKSKFISIVGNWEKQEVIYGFIQFLCITFSMFLFAIIK